MQRLSYTHPTLVQHSAIPLLLDGKDVLMQSDTGTGKTIGYLVPFLEKVLRGRDAGGADGGDDGDEDGKKTGEKRPCRCFDVTAM